MSVLSPSQERVVEAARKDPHSLGNVLIKLGYVNLEQIAAAVQRAGVRLGDALVEDGVINTAQLQAAVIHQEMLRGQRTPKDGLAMLMAEGTRVTESVTAGFHSVTQLSNAATGKLRR